MKTTEICQPAAAIELPKSAMLVRENRIQRTTIANTITTAAVMADGIAYGEN